MTRCPKPPPRSAIFLTPPKSHFSSTPRIEFWLLAFMASPKFASSFGFAFSQSHHSMPNTR